MIYIPPYNNTSHIHFGDQTPNLPPDVKTFYNLMDNICNQANLVNNYAYGLQRGPTGNARQDALGALNSLKQSIDQMKTLFPQQGAASSQFRSELDSVQPGASSPIGDEIYNRLYDNASSTNMDNDCNQMSSYLQSHSDSDFPLPSTMGNNEIGAPANGIMSCSDQIKCLINTGQSEPPGFY